MLHVATLLHVAILFLTPEDGRGSSGGKYTLGLNAHACNIGIIIIAFITVAFYKYQRM